MKNWYKNIFVDATVLFQLPYMQIWTALSRDSNQSSPYFYVSVLRELPNKLTVYENP